MTGGYVTCGIEAGALKINREFYMTMIMNPSRTKIAALTAIAEQHYGGIVPPAVQILIQEPGKNRITPEKFSQALNQQGILATPDTIINAMWRGRTPRDYKTSAPKVETVTRYKVEGYRCSFASQIEAEKFSHQVDVAKQIESLLIPRSVVPQELDFANGGKVYIQQNVSAIEGYVTLLRAAIISLRFY